MSELLKYVIERLQERSTWLGITGLIALLAGALSPDMQNAIVTVGMAVVSLISIFLKDKKIITVEK